MLSEPSCGYNSANRNEDSGRLINKMSMPYLQSFGKVDQKVGEK